jgi:hypothetical protein
MAKVHFTLNELEAYARGETTSERKTEVEQHLSRCRPCREFAAEFGVERQVTRIYVATHLTSDGVVKFWISRGSDRWLGGIDSPNIRSGRDAWSRDALIAEIETMFVQLFPEHACTSSCRRSADRLNQ